jgi:hypothetical protein
MRTPVARLRRIHESEAVKLLREAINSEELGAVSRPRLRKKIDRWERRDWKIARVGK